MNSGKDIASSPPAGGSPITCHGPGICDHCRVKLTSRIASPSVSRRFSYRERIFFSAWILAAPTSPLRWDAPVSCCTPEACGIRGHTGT